MRKFVILEHSVDEDRKLVEREHHGSLVLRQGCADRVAFLPPVSGVNPRPQLHAHLGNGQLIDSILDPAQIDEDRLKAPLDSQAP